MSHVSGFEVQGGDDANRLEKKRKEKILDGSLMTPNEKTGRDKKDNFISSMRFDEMSYSGLGLVKFQKFFFWSNRTLIVSQTATSPAVS